MIRIYANAAARFAQGAINWAGIQPRAHMIGSAYVPNLETHTSLSEVGVPLASVDVLNPAISANGWLSADFINFAPFVLTEECKHIVITQVSTNRLLFYIDFAPIPPSPTPRPFSLLFSAGAPGWCRL